MLRANQRVHYKLDHNFDVTYGQLLPSKRLFTFDDMNLLKIQMGASTLKRAVQIRDQNKMEEYRESAKAESDQDRLTNRITKIENTLKKMDDTLKAICEQLKNNKNEV